MNEECPYCGAEIEICHDDGYGYDEGEKYEQECHVCDKTFVYTTSICVYYELFKADCLNGGQHHYEKTITYPPEFAQLECKICGCRKPLIKETSYTERGRCKSDLDPAIAKLEEFNKGDA